MTSLLSADGVTPLAATTPNGLPYPVPTDPVQKGADDIKALALALDGRSPFKAMEARTVSIVTGADGAATITFLAPFLAQPIVIPTIFIYFTYVPAVVLTAVTTTTFSIKVFTLDNAPFATTPNTVNMNYLALGNR